MPKAPTISLLSDIAGLIIILFGVLFQDGFDYVT